MELLHLQIEISQQDWNAINGSVDNYLASSVKGFCNYLISLSVWLPQSWNIV